MRLVRVARRSEASKEKLRIRAKRAKRPIPPMPAHPGLLRFENYKQLVLAPDGRPFEEWTPIVYLSAQDAEHHFRDTRAILRFALPAFGGVVLATFYVYAHPWCPNRRGDGSVCPYPDPAPGGRLVVEMEGLLRRQIRPGEPLLVPDVVRIIQGAGSLEGRVAVVAQNREKQGLEKPYSKIAEIRLREGVENDL